MLILPIAQLLIIALVSANTTTPSPTNCSNYCRGELGDCINQQTDNAIICACNTAWYYCNINNNCTFQQGDRNNIEYNCQQFNCNCPFIASTITANASPKICSSIPFIFIILLILIFTPIR